MRTIYKIAKAELQSLFYSPIAWLILIVFIFQISLVFTGNIASLADSKAFRYSVGNVTSGIFTGVRGVFPAVLSYIHLYIPLLTMGLMSRELSSGTVKLLYSSPITNSQIILGKFASMLVYGLLFIGVLSIFVIYGEFTVKEFDLSATVTGLLGIYLVICAYAAIGLFMSSLTSYQVVAAITTLLVLSLLNYVKEVWQDVEFVRDITYWLSISGRAREFVRGLICSEDVLYFIIVSLLFLSLTILRLQALRQKTRWTISYSKYLVVFLLAMGLGYLTSRPVMRLYYDATHTKVNTLTPNSQDVVSRMDGGLTITTFVNILDVYYGYGLPIRVNWNKDQFKQYTRFKPEIKMKFVHYYDKADNRSLDIRYPGLSDRERMLEMVKIHKLDSNRFLRPEEIKHKIDLSGERNRFVRLLERESGERTFLRIYSDMQTLPSEAEISAAFKRLVMELPVVGFVKGHGERSITKEASWDYSVFSQEKTFRHALINQGFDISEVSLERGVPEEISILVIADMKEPLTSEEEQNLDRYIERGGNLIVAGEPRRQDIMNPIIETFGAQFLPGCLVWKNENHRADLIQGYPTSEGSKLAYPFENMRLSEKVVSMPGCLGIEYRESEEFTAVPLLVTDSIGCWNRIEPVDFVDDTVRLHPEAGEVESSYVTALALRREIGGREQKILILGDADCISNGELETNRRGVPASNFMLIGGLFLWMSDYEVPIDVRRPTPPDNDIYVTPEMASITKKVLVWGVPSLILILSILMWIRRRGR